MDQLRHARMSKIAQESTALMQKFVDEIQTSEEFTDTVGAWCQVLGSLIAQGHAITKESFEDLMPFVEGHIKVAYDHNMEIKNGKTKL